MALTKCPECGSTLTQEMIDVNMCWECGKILDTSQLDSESIEEIEKQADDNVMYDYLECPACGKKHHSNAKECSCGCNLLYNPKMDSKDIAKIYNARLEQYKKNAMYEYDVITIPNLGSGEVDINKIKAVIASHARNGWKLHTIYSNETGKNAVGVAGLGLNSTACEDVLVFERCIKSED